MFLKRVCFMVLSRKIFCVLRRIFHRIKLYRRMIIKKQLELKLKKRKNNKRQKKKNKRLLTTKLKPNLNNFKNYLRGVTPRTNLMVKLAKLAVMKENKRLFFKVMNTIQIKPNTKVYRLSFNSLDAAVDRAA